MQPVMCAMFVTGARIVHIVNSYTSISLHTSELCFYTQTVGSDIVGLLKKLM